MNDEIGHQIREVGHEYGTTTGRPRRVGWFDSVVMRHSRRVSGLTNLSLNSIDVLTGLDEVKICVAYDLDGERIDYYPASLETLQRCTPIYETLPGWSRYYRCLSIQMTYLKQRKIMFVASLNS